MKQKMMKVLSDGCEGQRAEGRGKVGSRVWQWAEGSTKEWEGKRQRFDVVGQDEENDFGVKHDVWRT